ncbi:hypothetical protein NX059_006479 [Plenodomus lindquistii]|nr:hypothetical protein NX059_006479 [Plenodomus lindquistii]
MAKSNDANKSRRPAIFKGGQRRRLTRQSDLPHPDPSAEMQTAASTAVEWPLVTPTVGARYEAMRTATPPEVLYGTTAFTLPLSSDSLPSHEQAATPPTATILGKKRFGLFPLKTTKDNERSENPSDMESSSPLPPMTPSKAQQLLGVESGHARTGANIFDNLAEHVKSTSPSHGFSPSLTSNQVANTRPTKFKEEDVDPDPPKKSSFWASNKKALKMLDPRGRHAKHTDEEDEVKSPREEEYNAAVMWASQTNTSQLSLDSRSALRPQSLPVAPRINPRQPRRRRKKGSKPLDTMAPITEMSHDALHTAYRHGESNTELDVISEYEAPTVYPPRSASFLPRSQTESALSAFGPYSLEAGDVSPEDKDDEEDYMTHPGSKVDLSRLKGKQPVPPRWRSPLQRYEDRLLDEAEEDLIYQEVNIGRRQAAKIELDDDVAALRKSHNEFKREFEAAKQQSHAREHPEAATDEPEDSDSDDDDLISISSSIDLDEEPCVCKAQAMPIIVGTGHVKEVYITKRNKDVKDIAPPRQQRFENTMPVSPTHQRNTSYNRLTKESKPKMPRSESQQLVQTWVKKYDRNNQRPLSERIDPDVLADQEIPPAPFPKDDPVSPHPPRTSSRHQCLQNGHIFRPIDLRQVPDEVGINTLEVRPYLYTPLGVKQHVHVPVCCGRCGEDVREELWECEIPICHVAVCAVCAVEMQVEWEKRAIASRMH